MTKPAMTLRILPIVFAGMAAFAPMAGTATTDALSEETGIPGIPADLDELLILDATEVDPDDLIWEWRIIAVLADTPSDPAFLQQMREIESRPDDLFERDVVVITDTARDSGSALRQRLRPRGFMLAIIGKDGEVKQRRPSPRGVREINNTIDKFPLRRQEMLDRLPSGRN